MRIHKHVLTSLVLLLALLFAGLSSGSVRAKRLTLETDHFLIHFHVSLEEIAYESAIIAEEVHETLSKRIGHTPSEKVHLFLLDETDLANGYADPILYPKIVIFPVSPVFFSPHASGMSPRMKDWLRLVITHEYAHVLQLDMNAGFGQAVERIFGRVPLLTNMMLLQGPAFFEGFATYEETVADVGGRGRDPLYDMFLRTMVLEDDFLRLDQILGHYPLGRWKPGAAAYLYGYGLWQFMADYYGDDAPERFNRAFARTASLGGSFRRALGVSPETFYEQWKADVGRRHEEDIELLRQGGPTPTTPVGGAGYVPQSPTASPDGQALAYATTNGPVAPALRLMYFDDDGLQDRQLIAAYVVGPIAWSPDGSQLYYAKVDMDGARTWSDLYRYEVATGREQRVTQGLRATGPALSPDGRTLIFTSRDGLATRLLAVDLDEANLPVRWEQEGGGAIRHESAVVAESADFVWEVLPSAGATQYVAAAWLADGRSIVVNSHEPGGGTDLLRLDMTSGELTPLVVGSRLRGGAGVVNTNPQLSPDKRFLLFDSDRSGVYNLYAFDTVTGDTFIVARTLTGLFHPTVIATSDGAALVAMEYTAKGYQLSVLPYEPRHWHTTAGTASGTRREEGERTPIVRVSPVDAGKVNRGVTVNVKPVALGGPRLYSPWSSLRPRYYLPLLGLDEAGLQIGALTSGYDALQEHFYSVAAGVGVGSGRPLFDVHYAGPLGRDNQLAWGFRIAQDTTVEKFKERGVFARQGAVTLAHEWPGVFAAGRLWGEAAFGTEQRVGPDPEWRGPEQNIVATSVGVDWARQRPVDDRNVTGRSRVALAHLSREDGTNRRRGNVATWQEEVTAGRDFGRVVFDGMVTLGASTLNDGITVGPAGRGPGVHADWGLNAPGADLVGRHALRLVAGAEQRLWRMSRGLGTAPVFFDELRGRLYVEGGMAFGSAGATGARRWGVGAELKLNTYLGYATPITVVIGAAASLERESAPANFYVGIVLDGN